MKHPVAARVLRYAAAGLLTLMVYIAVGTAVHRLALPMPWEASLAFGTAVAANYVLQRGWVFDDPRPVAASLPRYLLMIAAGYGVNILALAALAPRMPLIAAQLGAVTLVVISNASFAFFWVFLTPGRGHCGME